MLAFIAAHQVALASIGGIMLNEVIANCPAIEKNSLGQIVVAWLQGLISKVTGKPAA